MVPCCDYASEQDFESNGLFGGFLFPSTSEWEWSTSLDETSSLRKIVGSLTKTFSKILLFETLPIHRFELAIPWLFTGMAHFAKPEQEWMYPLQHQRYLW
jgi:hypothetical protein